MTNKTYCNLNNFTLMLPMARLFYIFFFYMDCCGHFDAAGCIRHDVLQDMDLGSNTDVLFKLH